MIVKFQYWNRIICLIDWLGVTPNYFAQQMGMLRAENLYQIKNGEYGISSEFADRVVRHFPEINRTWLLTGVGNMLAADTINGTHIPYYDGDILKILPNIAQITPSGFATLPFTQRCDMIVRMTNGDSIKRHNVQLFLRFVDLTHIATNNSYVIHTDADVLLCNVISCDDGWIKVVTQSGDEMMLETDKIYKAWLVVAKLEISANS